MYGEINDFIKIKNMDLMETNMKRITIFCGSSFGTDEIYKEQAYLLGKTQ